MDFTRKNVNKRFHLHNLDKYQFDLDDVIFLIESKLKNGTQIIIRRHKQNLEGFWILTEDNIAITDSIWTSLANNIHIISDEIYIQPGERFIQPKMLESNTNYAIQRIMRRDDSNF